MLYGFLDSGRLHVSEARWLILSQGRKEDIGALSRKLYIELLPDHPSRQNALSRGVEFWYAINKGTY